MADDNTAPTEEESMEDILHSIRDIIAEDDDDTLPDDTESTSEEDEAVATETEEEPPAETPAEEQETEEPAVDDNESDDGDDDVLELTELADEQEAADESEPIKSEPEIETEETPAEGVDQPTKAEESEAPLPAEEETVEAQPKTTEQPSVDPDLSSQSTAHLVSQTTADVTKKTLQQFVDNVPRPEIDSPEFRSGTTVETLVVETLRPMLSQWLDENLPILVEEIVQREIRKLLPHE